MSPAQVTPRSIRSLLSLVVLATAAVAADPPAREAPPDVYVPPSRPLDARIAPDKLTEQDPPPLPRSILLPLPPDHVIAEDNADVPVSPETWRRAREAIGRGVAYLRSAQDASGGWMIGAKAAPTPEGTTPPPPAPVDVAITALAVKAIVQAERGAGTGEDVARAVQFIRGGRQEDGSYAGDGLANYVTSAVVSALSSVDEFALRDEIRGGVTWLQRGQWDQSEGLDPRQDWFGGAGYGTHGRPDLSNTQMMLESLYDAGLSPDEPAFQRALAFVTRAQNLRATNRAEWTGDDGGFVYTPANGGESMASEAAGEGRRGENLPPGAPRSLRSYGSMTYAGFKSLLYAGLSPDDLRVRAAFDWIRRHWTFEENPGLGAQGLYYYYHAMARALRVAQQPEIVDVDGRVHDWRTEMIDAIASRQRADGSWINTADRWLEGEPVLATAYAVLALEEAMKPVSRLLEGLKAPERGAATGGGR